MKRLPVILALLVAAASVAEAQVPEVRTQRAGFILGLGTWFDQDGSGDIDPTIAGNYRWQVEKDTLVGVRAGGFSLSGPVGERSQGDVFFASIAGEYLLNEGGYQSGLFLGLGVYHLNSDRATDRGSDTGVGLHGGVTGDFLVTEAMAVLVELSVHWTGIGDVDFLASLGVGLSWHF